MDYDLFISHASEDKEFVRPLAAELQGAGLRVWLDELELRLGDSLRRTIDGGLARSKYGVVVLSPAFLQKEWPNKELDGLFARESGGEKVVLPIWHNVSASDIAKLSPLLADRLAVSTSTGLKHVADQVIRAVRASAGAEPRYLASCESEEQTLRRIREKMLVARSSRDLRGALYELEAYLARYPHSPDARMLRDELSDAAQSEARMHRLDLDPSPRARSGATSAVDWIVALALLLLLVALWLVRFNQ
jgi:hypothetical protein